MPFQPAPGVAKIAIEGQLLGESVVNTLHFQGTTPWSLQELGTLGNFIDGWWTAQMVPQLASGYEYVQTVATDIRTQVGSVWISAGGAGAFGQVLGQTAPNNVSIAISFSTGLTGRTQRGRNFIPGLSEANIENNRLNGFTIAGLVGTYSNLLPGQNVPAPWLWCVLSRYFNNTKRANAAAGYINFVSVKDNVIDSQRRRLPKRGT